MQNIVFGASESCINCYCLILLVFIFKYLYLFGLKRGLKILFGQFWSPKSPILPRSDYVVADLYDKNRINFSCQVNSGIKFFSKFSFFYIFLKIYDVLNIICCYYVDFLPRNPKKQHIILCCLFHALVLRVFYVSQVSNV